MTEYRTSSRHPDQNLTDMLRVLDAAAVSGAPVLLNIGVDLLASRTFNKTYNATGGIDPRIPPPRTDLTACGGEAYCEFVRAGVLAYRDHPGLASYCAPRNKYNCVQASRAASMWLTVPLADACDDCCHITKGAAALVEYENIAAVKASLFELDPYHLMFGTAACDDIWLWCPRPRVSPRTRDAGPRSQ
jgi:hypothetical protein